MHHVIPLVLCFPLKRVCQSNKKIFVNIQQIIGYLRRHSIPRVVKTDWDATDPQHWVYKIGKNGDCSADVSTCGDVKDLIDLFTEIPIGKLTFATKFVDRDGAA